MSFDTLQRRIPPPVTPNEVGGSWDTVFRALGTPLPDDYCQFVDSYGTGYLARFYTVVNPFSTNRYVNMMRRLDMIRSSESQSTFFPDAGYCFYPEDGGLIPWMLDDNGNDYFWRTAGSPNDWPVVQCEHRGSGFTEYPMTMSAFLLAVFDQTISALASDFPSAEDEVFESQSS